MKVTKAIISGLLIIEPDVFEDSRGYFYEPYNKLKFSSIGIDLEFLQDNQSLSQKGVLRGLHFQAPPFAQVKLVRVITGSVLDVAVDIRRGSSTYGQHFSIILSGQNKKMFLIPEGFAHGFLSLEDNSVFCYKCSEVYDKASEQSLFWNDEDLLIDWKCDLPLLSEKDKIAPRFKDFISPF